MDINFVSAGPDNLDEVFDLVRAATDNMISKNIYQWDEIYPCKEILRDDIEKGQLYIGTTEGRIVVIFVLNKECEEEYRNGRWKYEDKSFFVIHRLCVNPEFQNRGVAKEAMGFIEHKLKTMGAEAIRLDAYSLNPYALKLYEALGYERVGYADWRKGRFYLMEKYL